MYKIKSKSHETKSEIGVVGDSLELEVNGRIFTRRWGRTSTVRIPLDQISYIEVGGNSPYWILLVAAFVALIVTVPSLMSDSRGTLVFAVLVVVVGIIAFFANKTSYIAVGSSGGRIIQEYKEDIEYVETLYADIVRGIHAQRIVKTKPA
jgi:hypothetical protein